LAEIRHSRPDPEPAISHIRGKQAVLDIIVIQHFNDHLLPDRLAQSLIQQTDS